MKKLLAVLLFAATPAFASDALLFRDARVFDGTRVLADTDVLVRNGRIERIGSKLAVPAEEVIDAKGKTLLPGLIDAHTHVWGDALTEALMFGVTTELDQFSNAAMAKTMREQQAAGKANDRADLFSAGTLVTAPGGHGTEYGFAIPTITAPGEAQAFVDARIAEGSDWIKLVYDDGSAYGMKWPTITAETMRAVIDAAHKRGKLAVVHIASAAGARAAIDAGANGLVHLFNDKVAENFVIVAKNRGAFVIPTLLVQYSITGKPGAESLIHDARLEPYLNDNARDSLSRAFPTKRANDLSVAKEMVKRLKTAGVPILAGTDAPNPGTAHGVALHRELEMLVEAGLSPVEALAAATSVPARAFHIADRGRIAKGLRADLLLVAGDPTTDITATRAIEGVWKGGVRADRAAFAKAIADARAASSDAKVADIGDGLISDFDHDAPSASFGTPWIVSTDSIAGGKSTGKIEVASGALHVTGTISDALPYAWAGAMWSPGPQPMTPANLSHTKELRFRTRGDGGTYRMLVFAKSKGMFPLTRTFVADAEWREVVMPWSAFGIDAHDIMAVLFVGGPQAGAFKFEVDDVRLE